MAENTTLVVRVTDFRHAPRADARVTATSLRPKGRATQLQPTEASGVFLAESLEPGTWEIAVSAPQFAAQKRRVEIAQPVTRETFYLGTKEMLAYYRGRVRVPFEAPLNLIAIALKGEPDDESTAMLDSYASELGLRPHGEADTPAGRNPMVLAAEKDLEPAERAAILSRFATLPFVEHVGPVVDHSPGSVSFLTDEICVKFVPGTDREKAAGVLRGMDGEVLTWLTAARTTAHVRMPIEKLASFELLRDCEKLMERDDVVSAEPNMSWTVEYDFTPNDFLFNQQPHLQRIRAEQAWDVTMGSEEIIIAVVDNGCDVSHPDLTTTVFQKIYSPFNFLGMNTDVFNPSTDPDDSPNHGSLSAGIAAALADNGEGVAGVAPRCRLMPVRRGGGTDLSYAQMYRWIAGLDAASATPGFPGMISPGADVISNSFGLNQLVLSQTMSDAFDEVTTLGRNGLGCVVLFSVGNHNVDFTVPSPSPVDGKTKNGRRWAEYGRTIAVASSTVNLPEVKAIRSNFGPALDVCASGGGHRNGPQQRTMSTANMGLGSHAGAAGAVSLDYETYGQTSCACPQVAGVAALMLSVRPDLRWHEVRNILRQTADRIDIGNTDPVGQWVDLDGDGFAEFSQWYGYGRINAARAVMAARRPLPILAVHLEDELDFGTVCQDFENRILRVFNVGQADLRIDQITNVGSTQAFAVMPMPFVPLVIAPGSHVDFNIRYTQSGIDMAEVTTIRIESNDPITPVFDLEARAVAGSAKCELAIADAGDFGPACVGRFVDRDLVVNNSGRCPLRISSIISSAPAFVPPGVNAFPLIVAPGAAMVLPIRFQPPALGSFDAELRVISNDPDDFASVRVSGHAPPPRLVLSLANAGGFPATCLGGFTDQPLLISNSGDCALSITSITSSIPQFVVPQVLAFPLVIAPGGSASVMLRFQPTALGEWNGTITLLGDDPAGAAVLHVSGRAPGGVLTLTGTTQFGPVELGAREVQTLSICNTGCCPLQVDRVAFRPPGPCEQYMAGCGGGCGCMGDCKGECNGHGKADCKCLDFTILTNPFPAKLHPGSCLGVTIAYAPGCNGAACCELIVESDDPERAEVSVLVTGTLRRTLSSALKCWAGDELRAALIRSHPC